MSPYVFCGLVVIVAAGLSDTWSAERDVCIQPSGPETGGSHPSSTSVPAASQSVNSHAVPTASPPHGANTETLSELMANLSENMTRQGVSTESKGVCAACSKPIIGQVTCGLF